MRLALAALRAVVQARHPPSGGIHHSDRGVQGEFKWKWFRTYKEATKRAPEEILVQSWDVRVRSANITIFPSVRPGSSKAIIRRRSVRARYRLVIHRAVSAYKVLTSYS